MDKDLLQTKYVSVASLHLDAKNPRLGRETTNRAPRDIIQYLFDHDKALEVAQSIATRGYFPNEPLLAIKEAGQLIVVEGNRRLAALKALREPGLLEGRFTRKLDHLSKKIGNLDAIARVPVTVAPNRKATDRQVAGRHIGTPVLPWQAENRASFILDKLSEGYSNSQLQLQLGFSAADIQAARQTRAIADMARALDLPDEVKAKIDNPRAKLFTTLERIFGSTVGREYLFIEPDTATGIRGTTSASEFVKGFGKLVTDIALGRQSSRTLNTNENIRSYFESLGSEHRPIKKAASFVPDDILAGRSGSSRSGAATRKLSPAKGKSLSPMVLPRNFKVRFGSDRLVDMRLELVRLKREKFPNAGAVLLRVFFEVAIVDYLSRTGDLATIVTEIERKGGRLPQSGVPTLKQLTPAIIRLSKAKLKASAAQMVEKAITYNPSAPFSISELHGFVHGTDLPTARDIQQFWHRTEPLFRLMLEQDLQVAVK